jgi:ubiquinone/menaquinone biosynthesis C-methylase UbiE
MLCDVTLELVGDEAHAPLIEERVDHWHGAAVDRGEADAEGLGRLPSRMRESLHEAARSLKDKGPRHFVEIVNDFETDSERRPRRRESNPRKIPAKPSAGRVDRRPRPVVPAPRGSLDSSISGSACGGVRCGEPAARRRVAAAKRMPKRERWQVAGNAAEIYQRELVPAVFGPWAKRVIELAELRPGLRVLDVACGTGVVARLAAETVGVDGLVAALDLNSGMLAVAAELPAVEGAPIEWIEGTAQAVPFADASFDVVCCQLGLQFFPDREGALREMKRVLVPSGRAVVMVWREIDRAPGFAVLAAALGRTIGPDAEALMTAPFSLSDAHELSRLLETAGLRDCAIRAETGNVRFLSSAMFVRSYVGGSPLASMVAAAPAAAYEKLVREVERALDPLIEQGSRSLSFRIEAHLARCRA